MHGNKHPPPSCTYGIHPCTIYKALINAGWGPKQARIRPMRWDFHMHRGRSDEFIPRALHRVPALRDRFKYLQTTHSTRSEGADASFEGLRAHRKQGANEYAGREETSLLPIRELYPRPLMALSQQFRGCTSAPVWIFPTRARS